MSLLIFGDMFTFPEGNAATNRIYTFAKGFNENNLRVHVVCFGIEYTTDGEGTLNGIHYHHPFGQERRNKYFIIRRFQKFLKYFKTYRLIRKINNHEKITAIIILTNLFLTHLFAWFLSRLFKTKLIIECSEHPLRHFQKGPLNKKQGELKFFLESNLSDGIFCISRFLVDFHRNHGIDGRKLLLVPSTVDPSRFIQTAERPFPFDYIGYFGNITFVRDNVDLLINGFGRICGNHPEIHLVLGGFCSADMKRQMEELITRLNISNRVTLLEYLKREEIINYISNACVLVMVRSQDMQSQASYPSKLTEYLTTGKPVITVNVGEISDFITDKVNAYLVEPGNVTALAEKLEFVLDNYGEALHVGMKGKELTNDVFNYNYQASRMIGFINTI